MKRRNLKLLAAAVLASAILVSPLTGTRADGATIKADFNVNVRASASISAKKTEYIHSGQTVNVMGLENGWYKIDQDGSIGYTFHSFWSASSVTSLTRANVRQTAYQLSPAIFQVASATQAIVLGRSGEWLYIKHNGSKGFSHKTYWDIPESVFAELPDATDESEAAAKLFEKETEEVKEAEEAEAEAEESAGAEGAADAADAAETEEAEDETETEASSDTFTVDFEIAAYANAADAEAGSTSIGLQPMGTYFIQKIEKGLYYITETLDKPGVWIDPAQTSIGSGDEYPILSSQPGYMNAMNAASGVDPVVTVTPGTYYVYRVYDGMYNVSTSKTAPGAWIDPAVNRAAQAAALSPIGDRIVEEALKLIGAPYILGAESWEEGGFDCSGVTNFSYGQLGVSIPRTASQQWAGIEGKVTVPRPGDIIAFEKEGEVYHVGVYVGDDQMIHAPKPGDQVKLSDLAWWYKNSTVKGFLRPYSD